MFKITQSFITLIHQTPLHKAVENNHQEIVQLLLDSGAEIKVLDAVKQSPEGIAKAKKLYDILGVISSFEQKHDESLSHFNS